MRGKHYTLLYICLFMLYAFPASSMNNFFFSHLGVEDGLSQLAVMNIYQDSDGYLWFGTRNGVNRYDGYEFRIYQNEVNNPESLSDNNILCIAEDGEKNIYIGTSNGLNRIDHQTGHITRYYPRAIDSICPTNVVNRLLRQPDGTLYAFSSQYVFTCSTGKKPERIKSLTDIGSPIISVAQGENGNLYIGTNKTGLYIYSPDWKLLQHLQAKVGNKNQVLPSSSITALLPDKQNRIWIASDEEGLFLFDLQTQTSIHLNKDNSGLSSNSIRTLITFNDSTVLTGTFRGLNMLNTEKLTVAPVSMNITGKGGLSHYSIHSTLIDSDQTLWVGTYSAGVNYHSPFYTPMSYIMPNEFTGIIGKGQEDQDGNMWFVTEGAGLFCYNPLNGQRQLYPIKPLHEGNYETNILKSIRIQGDSLYCSTHFGSVYLFSIRSKQYKKLYDSKHNDIYTLYIDRKKRLWIPTNNEQNLVLADREKVINSFPSDGSMRPFKAITTICEIEPDRFLFGSRIDSIYLYDLNKKTTTNITNTLQTNHPQERLGTTTAILQDSKLDIWIATSKSGLFRLDKQLKLVKHYQREDGLSESYISTLTLDKNKDIWVTTGKMLYKLNPSTDKFVEVSLADIPPLEFTLYAGNSLSSDGSLYFPSDKGILTFNPQKLTVNPNIPRVYITSLLVNNKENITNLGNQAIILKSNQSNIAIRYTALNFIHSKNNQYTYTLEGADHSWHTVGNRREAYYSNLAPGTYTFRVAASNNDGVWNPQEAVLHITVDPPFYKTWWAYLLYISIVVVFILRIIRYQQNKHEREREARYKQMEQEKTNELHEERMRMFTNFSHELRTPLTLILNPLNDLLQHVSFSPEVKNALQLIKKNTGRMLLLVNNLMDIQKYEAGKTILQKTRFDFSAFMREMYHSFESVAGNREIAFTLHNQLSDPYYACLDEAEIEKVFFNLLSNAFKFTPAGGSVSIRISSLPQQECEALPLFPTQQSSILIESKYLFIEVTDTGNGFSNKEAEKIFEPFYRSQEDIHRQISGTGIGLSLTRSIVLQHNGCIWTESSEQHGTRFMLLIPDTEKQDTGRIQHEAILQSSSAEISRKVNLLVEETEAKNRQTILLADDNQEVLQYLEQQLRNDYIIMKAINGKDALAQIEQHYPNIVISDIMMPEMNGLELCRRIKENQNYCHIPVILLTAKSMVSQIEEGLEAGADDYIVKPFHVSLLKARIRNILSLREKMKAMYGDALSLKHLGVEEPEEDNDFLSQYIELVKANISNQELDVSVIYQALGMSRANFYRKVKTVTGLSPIELIKNIRLEAGARLLKESTMNISEIAQHIGFSSRSYFARSFKAVYGVSPTEYQELPENKNGPA